MDTYDVPYYFLLFSSGDPFEMLLRHCSIYRSFFGSNVWFLDVAEVSFGPHILHIYYLYSCSLQVALR